MRTLPLVALMIAMLAGCHDSNVAGPAVPRSAPVVSPEWVTGAARAALDAHGRFVLPRTAAPGEIDEHQAVALGDAWLKQFGPLVRTALQQERGGAIDLEKVQACGRPLYAGSSYRNAGADVPLPVRQLHGSWWLLSYCNESGDAVVSLSVSALATNITWEDGRIHFPASHGTEFIWYGIPTSLSGLPVSAERAVAAAFETTGLPVADVPELIAPPRPNAPFSSLWHLVLAQAAALSTADGAKRSSRDLYVRYTGLIDKPSLLVAAGAQPTTVSFKLLTPVAMRIGPSGKLEPAAPSAGQIAGAQSWTIARRDDRPLLFEAVTDGKEVRK